MNTPLTIRTYNVRFGDAFLLKVPDHDASGNEVMRHILIDVGNVLTGEGGSDDVFQPVIEDVMNELDGNPLDLYIMTHEHMDHVQGLLHASEKLGLNLDIDYVWLTASAEEDYYDRFDEAKKHFDMTNAVYDNIEKQLTLLPATFSGPLSAMLANNNPRKTADCVAFIRQLASVKTSYVFRDCPLENTHPFRDAKFRIWAPEEDTSDYYGRFQPMAMGVTDANLDNQFDLHTADLKPPPGVDAGAFYNLVQMREMGVADNLMTIDKAKNNTSVVFSLEWHGWELLFTGDAEKRSWKTMDKKGVLSPVDFIKVSHHGSHNGTPKEEILNQVLPMPADDEMMGTAIISTCANTYNNVPHEPTQHELEERCEVFTTEGMEAGEAFDIEFEA